MSGPGGDPSLEARALSAGLDLWGFTRVGLTSSAQGDPHIQNDVTPVASPSDRAPVVNTYMSQMDNMFSPLAEKSCFLTWHITPEVMTP